MDAAKSDFKRQAIRHELNWIVSRPYDLVFFIFSFIIPLIFCLLFQLDSISVVSIYFLFQILFNMPHNSQTWTLSIFDRNDWANNKRTYLTAFACLFLFFGIEAVIHDKQMMLVTESILIYLGYYHLGKQNYGILQIYGAKAKVFRRSRAYVWLLQIAIWLPLLMRFSCPEKMNVKLGDMRLAVLYPEISPDLVLPLQMLWALIVLFLLRDQIRYFKTVWSARCLYLISVLLTYFVAFYIENLVVAVIFVTATHNIQYGALVYFHNLSYSRKSASPSVFAVWAAHFKWKYIAYSFVYGIVIFTPILLFPQSAIARIPFQIIVAMHYFVDARIWRMGHYPERRSYLNLS